MDALQKAVTGYGPTDAQKTTFLSSFFGSVFGLATAAVLSAGSLILAVYLVTTFVMGSLVPMNPTELGVFAAVLGLALLVAAFFVVPLVAKVRRERAITRLSTDPTVRHGYFRLGPWTGDHEDVRTFRRPDGREARARDWLIGARSPVLYLSGASGVGKSSLVESYLIPALRAQNWTVLSIRGMGNPHAALMRALEEAAGAPADGLREALDLAVQHIGAGPGKPLLVILDQFEEFLTQETRPDGDYAAVLRDLAARPVPHVHLLHVFREDYRAQLFALDLPDVTRETGFDLPRLDRRQAEAFLRGGPRKLDDAGYQALFDGLNRIEDTPGLYRLITLNLIGVILDRQGATVPRNPAALIRDYLTSVIGAGLTRDLHKPILRAMITAEGNRIAVATGALATAAGTEGPKCRAALAHLAEEGLVRPAGPDRWEISHDFLARQIATLLPTLRRPAVERFGGTVLVAMAVGWLAAAGLSWPLWEAWQDRIAVASLRDMGLVQENCGGPVCFAYQGPFGPHEDLADLSLAAPHLSRIGATELNLSNADRLTDLSALAELPLTKLYFSGARGFSDLSSLSGMPLTHLTLLFEGGINGLSELPERLLNDPFIFGPVEIADLSPLVGLPLTSLNIGPASGITDLSPLAGLPLTNLGLHNAISINDLSPLAGLPLTTLGLHDANSITDLSPLTGLSLTALSLRNATGITSLSPLAGMPLSILDLSGATGITDLSPLAGMPLSDLILSNATGITDLSPLAGTPLYYLELSGAIGITDLSPLRGIPGLEIGGATEAQLATLGR